MKGGRASFGPFAHATVGRSGVRYRWQAGPAFSDVQSRILAGTQAGGAAACEVSFAAPFVRVEAHPTRPAGNRSRAPARTLEPGHYAQGLCALVKNETSDAISMLSAELFAVGIDT